MPKRSSHPRATASGGPRKGTEATQLSAIAALQSRTRLPVPPQAGIPSTPRSSGSASGYDGTSLHSSTLSSPSIDEVRIRALAKEMQTVANPYPRLTMEDGAAFGGANNIPLAVLIRFIYLSCSYALFKFEHHHSYLHITASDTVTVTVAS